MKKDRSFLLVFSILLFAVFLRTAGGSADQFTFVSWGDTKEGLSILAAQSNQAKVINPAFTIYAGDLVSPFSLRGLEAWRDAINGDDNDGMFDRTFAVRGNHDKGDHAGWQEFFDFRRVSSVVGAKNYRFMADKLTYSFDYGNSHFIGVDVLGDVTLLSEGQINWMDRDLSLAEQRGLTHAFAFWHGPLYPVGPHCCSASKSEFISMANRHPILSATFHGHEHLLAWVHIDAKRYPNDTHQFEEFVTGSSGATTHACREGRSDYCRQATGFATVDVSGKSFTVKFFLDGNSSPGFVMTFSKDKASGSTRPLSDHQ